MADERFQIRDFTGVEVAFGARNEDYLTREECGEFYDWGNPYSDVASRLFNSGGTLADFGLKWKKDVDEAKAMLAMRALLGSWAPKHEIKLGTVGKLLHDNTDGKVKIPKPKKGS